MEPERRRFLIEGEGEEEEAPVVKAAEQIPKPAPKPKIGLGLLTYGELADEWGEVAKRELEEELEVTTEYRDYTYYEEMGAIALESTSGEANNGESQWIVFENEDEAGRAAISRVRDDLENEPCIFSRSFLEQHLNEEAFEDFLREDATSLAEDHDESDLVEMGYLEAFDDDGEEIEHTEREIEKARESWIEDDVQEKLRIGPMDLFCEIYGEHEAAQHAIEAFGIDIDKAAEDAVDTDGIAHFLDVYDGSTVELPSGAVAYGTN